LEKANREQLDRLAAETQERIQRLREERDRLRERLAEMEEMMARLDEENKEARMKALFAVSKSGDKLVRVVRSVQELACELDEASRAVTGGEYSLLEEIKDKQDRDTILSLAAGAAQVDDGARSRSGEALEAEDQNNNEDDMDDKRTNDET